MSRGRSLPVLAFKKSRNRAFAGELCDLDYETTPRNIRPLGHNMSLKCAYHSRPRHLIRSCGHLVRAYSATTPRLAEAESDAQAQPPAPKQDVDPESAATWRDLKALRRAGKNPVGSRRRRAALKEGQGVPFEQMPFQTFQEARKILALDRDVKLKKIESEKIKISNLEAKSGDGSPQADSIKKGRLMAMRKHLEYLKVQADINDPVIKKRFEDRQGELDSNIRCVRIS